MNNFAFVVGFFTSIVSTHCSCSWPRSQSKFQTKLGNTKQPGNQKWCRLVLNGTLVFERRSTVWLISAFLKVLSSGLKAFVGNMAFPKNGIFSFNNSRQNEYIWHHKKKPRKVWHTAMSLWLPQHCADFPLCLGYRVEAWKHGINMNWSIQIS